MRRLAILHSTFFLTSERQILHKCRRVEAVQRTNSIIGRLIRLFQYFTLLDDGPLFFTIVLLVRKQKKKCSRLVKRLLEDGSSPGEISTNH